MTLPVWSAGLAGLALVYIGWQDFKAREVPVSPLIGLAVLGVARLATDDPGGLAGSAGIEHGLTAAGLGLVFGLVASVRWRTQQMLGAGDAGLAVVLGLWFGLAAIPALSLAAAACGLSGLISGQKQPTRLPLASFMALAGVGLLGIETALPEFSG